MNGASGLRRAARRCLEIPLLLAFLAWPGQALLADSPLSRLEMAAAGVREGQVGVSLERPDTPFFGHERSPYREFVVSLLNGSQETLSDVYLRLAPVVPASGPGWVEGSLRPAAPAFALEESHPVNVSRGWRASLRGRLDLTASLAAGTTTTALLEVMAASAKLGEFPVHLDPRVPMLRFEPAGKVRVFGRSESPGTAYLELRIENVGPVPLGRSTLRAAAVPQGASADLDPAASLPGQYLLLHAAAIESLPPHGTIRQEMPLVLAAGTEVRGMFDLVVEVSELAATRGQWRLVAAGLEGPATGGLGWLLAAALLPLPVLAWYLLVFRHPIVRRAAVDPGFLASLSLAEQKAAAGFLHWSGQGNFILGQAHLDRARWRRALSATEGPGEALRAFCGATGSTLKAPPAACGPGLLAAVTLPPLRATLDQHLHVLAVGQAQDLALTVASLPGNEGEGWQGCVLPVLLPQSAGAPGAALQGASTRFGRTVLLDEPRLRAILLDPEPAGRFLKELAACMPPQDLSPYITQGAITQDHAFFGRKRELETLATGHAPNVLLYGPRGIGKSSLLKAVERRFREDREFEPRYVHLSGSELEPPVRTMLAGLGLPADGTLRELLGRRGPGNRLPYWLLDETDLMVEADAAAGFATLQDLRALREEGRARFILAGYWELFRIAEAAHSPLRNFAETMRLGPLDATSAREFITRPLQDLGLDYEDPRLQDELLHWTGCRPNLIGTLCNLMLRQLRPGDRSLTRQHLERAMRDDTLVLSLSSWQSLARGAARDDAKAPADLLDRAVFYLVMLAEQPPRVEDLAAGLGARGVNPGTLELLSSVDRLRFAFRIVEDGERYRVAVPLFTRILLERSPAELLDELLDELRNATARSATRVSGTHGSIRG